MVATAEEAGGALAVAVVVKQVQQSAIARSLMGFGSRWLLVALFVLGAALRVSAAREPALRSPDERIFNRQASYISTKGPAAISDIAGYVRRNPSEWFGPSPLRVGYTGVLAAMMRVSGSSTEVGAVGLSLLSSLGCLFLAWHLGRRYLSTAAAVFGVLMMTVSPLELILARRAWQDAYTELLSLSLLTLTSHVLSGAEHRRRTLVGIAAIGAYGVLVKEAVVLVFFLCGVVLMLDFARRRDLRSAMGFMAAGLGMSAAAVGWLGYLLGSIGAVVSFEHTWLHMGPLNPYSMAFETGPPGDLVLDLFSMSPTVFVGGVIGVFVLIALLLRQPGVTRSVEVRSVPFACMLALFTLFFFILPLLTPGRLNLRYAGPAFGTLDLLAGIGLAAVYGVLRRQLSPLGPFIAVMVVTFAIGVAAYRDYGVFHNRMLPLQDLSIGLLKPMMQARTP